jgi:uncharacterized protein (TIGR02231 family)
MRHILSITLVLTSLWALAGQVPSEIKSVTVFQTRAEVVRTAKVELAKGNHELVFSGISTLIDKNNIRVKGTGNLIILGISFRQNFLDENALPDDLQKVKEQIAALELKIKKTQNEIDALKVESTLLNTNQKIAGNDAKLTVAELKAMADYYRARSLEITNTQLDLNGKIAQYNDELRKLRAHYNDRTSKFKTNSGEIVVNVDAKATTVANLELIYLVSGAGWTAEYDVRADDVDSPLQLNYKAIVNQSTGENWKNVSLTLSTGDPTISGQKPVMYPQYVDFYYQSSYKEKAYATGAVSRAMAPADDEMKAEEIMDIGELSQNVQTDVKTMYTNYVIDLPYSLNSGEKPITVTIRDQQVLADYEYHTLPKLMGRVYLIAKAKNWGELVLLPGPMNIYFEGGFVGKSYLNPNTTEDAIVISLGYDPGITVERKLQTDLTSKKTIGTNKREQYAYEISIRNNKRKAVKVIVYDQIPVTKNTDIKVEEVILNGATHNTVTGEISWTVDLQPGKQEKRNFGFVVRYPKDKSVTGL